MTPPATNPYRHAAKAKQHWANPQELRPGIWLIEQKSGPKATTIDVIIVRYDQAANYWYELGDVGRPRYGVSTLNFHVDFAHTWKITSTNQGELIQQLVALVKDHF